MYELKKKKIGNILTSKSVWTGPSSYEKRIYRAAVSQRLSNTTLEKEKTLVLLTLSSIKLAMRHPRTQWSNKLSPAR